MNVFLGAFYQAIGTFSVLAIVLTIGTMVFWSATKMFDELYGDRYVVAAIIRIRRIRARIRKGLEDDHV